jgi:hypothetical protein
MKEISKNLISTLEKSMPACLSPSLDIESTNRFYGPIMAMLGKDNHQDLHLPGLDTWTKGLVHSCYRISCLLQCALPAYDTSVDKLLEKHLFLFQPYNVNIVMMPSMYKVDIRTKV